MKRRYLGYTLGILLGLLVVSGYWYITRTPSPETEEKMRIYETPDPAAANRLSEMSAFIDEKRPFDNNQIDFLIDHVRKYRDTDLTGYGFLVYSRNNPYRREEWTELLREAAQRRPPIPGTLSSLRGLARMGDPQARSLIEQALSDPAFANEWDQQFLKNILKEIDQGPSVQPTPNR
jgi:hypothetical protein